MRRWTLALWAGALFGCNGDKGEGDGYADADGDGYTTQYDCDDEDAAVYPTADELCDGVDNNCDDAVDETAAVDAGTFYADGDGDGYGSADETTACEPPPGYVADSSDCDDGNAAVSPGSKEICDEADNDCDGQTDEDVQSTFYGDADGDGHGAGDATTQACAAPAGYAAADDDCDDGDNTLYPGAPEICGNGIVEDCDGDDASADNACFWGPSLDISSAGAALTPGSEQASAGLYLDGGADVTGDGIDDLLVGAPLAAPGGLSEAGSGWIVPGPVDADADLSGVGWGILGAAEGDRLGGDLGAADIDGDGHDDLLVAATGADGDLSDAGAVWMVAGPLSAAPDLSALDALWGDVASQRIGATLALAGDTDGDGVSEILVSAPESVTAWLVDPFATGPITEAAIATFAGADLSGAGQDMAAAGDVDGDGADDVLIGAPTGGVDFSGAAYLMRGPLGGEYDLAAADTAFTGDFFSGAGLAVEGLGDLDDDGYADIAIGAPGTNFFSGAVGIFGGGAAIGSAPISAAVLRIEGASGAWLGGDLAVTDDMDGDGEGELLVGSGLVYLGSTGATASPGASPQAWLFASDSGLSALSGTLTADVVFNGVAKTSFGMRVSGAGDIDDDGRPDVAIGGVQSGDPIYLFLTPGY